jgi:hypothetical protein
VRKLFSQIPFPGLDVDASVFETDEIWECIQQNEKVLQHEFAQGLLTVC